MPMYHKRHMIEAIQLNSTQSLYAIINIIQNFGHTLESFEWVKDNGYEVIFTLKNIDQGFRQMESNWWLVRDVDDDEITVHMSLPEEYEEFFS